MSNRSRNYEEGNDDMNMEDDMIEDNRPGKCARFLSYTWRFCTCVFSHTVLVSMVVSYCVLGAFTFEALEKEYEKSVKRNITWIRGNLTNEIWSLVQSSLILHEEVWTHNVTTYLEAFEGDLLFAMKKNGWDGDDDVEQLQWTFAGALFYSIIVITTIGYGHIAPKTHWGKVVTIFYAILGIPLMLLCLSNIGDVMATSFRFLYWRVCCYVCTKKPRKHRSRRLRPGRPTIRQQTSRFSGRSRTASFKRSGRTSQRSADSGFGLSEITPSSYSDTECRYNGDASTSAAPEPLQRHLRPSQMSHNSDTAATTSTRTGNATPTRVSNIRGGSLDRRRQARGTTAMDSANDAPVLCNRYAVDRELRQNPIPERRDAKTEEPKEDEPAPARRSQSVPRQQNFLEPPPCTSVAVYDEQPVKKKDRKRPVQHHPPTARIMSPMGFAVHRQHNLTVYDDESDDNDMDDAYSDAYYSGSGEGRRVDRTKPVPIWLCVFLVVSYIIAGAFLFKSWEEWAFLDSAYFCFITLTTIGFGDFVPANRVGSNNSVSIALCSLYLLFGIALLAMSFNLVQEEVIANVRSVAKKLGIIKEEERDEDDDDD